MAVWFVVASKLFCHGRCINWGCGAYEEWACCGVASGWQVPKTKSLKWKGKGEGHERASMLLKSEGNSLLRQSECGHATSESVDPQFSSRRQEATRHRPRQP